MFTIGILSGIRTHGLQGNIQNIQIKTSTSVSLPIYSSLPTLKDFEYVSSENCTATFGLVALHLTLLAWCSYPHANRCVFLCCYRADPKHDIKPFYVSVLFAFG